jgi:hypothetical protein
MNQIIEYRIFLKQKTGYLKFRKLFVGMLFL